MERRHLVCLRGGLNEGGGDVWATIATVGEGELALHYMHALEVAGPIQVRITNAAQRAVFAAARDDPDATTTFDPPLLLEGLDFEYAWAKDS